MLSAFFPRFQLFRFQPVSKSGVGAFFFRFQGPFSIRFLDCFFFPFSGPSIWAHSGSPASSPGPLISQISRPHSPITNTIEKAMIRAHFGALGPRTGGGSTRGSWGQYRFWTVFWTVFFPFSKASAAPLPGTVLFQFSTQKMRKNRKVENGKKNAQSVFYTN